MIFCFLQFVLENCFSEKRYKEYNCFGFFLLLVVGATPGNALGLVLPLLSGLSQHCSGTGFWDLTNPPAYKGCAEPTDLSLKPGKQIF